ncbi:hypothetical protein AZE42_02938 [Rhizopogon vesiculosus]|uniref:DH domain-containing protein n=1 Tax=Rhizopogon vesiculosus TaxID=180088 RepID=A0A1J8QDT6_9AGAM|nr:hypothetical protein AZE42_02938 [Rhizopogon vesiculosus]
MPPSHNDSLAPAFPNRFQIDRRPASWVDMNSVHREHPSPDLDLITAHPSAALLPSSDSPNSTRFHSRPSTPSVPGATQIWTQDYGTQNSSILKAVETSSLDEPSPSTAGPMISSQPSHSTLQKPLARSVSEGESSFRLDISPTHSFARPPKVPPLPDPSQFPDPYPQRSPFSRMSDRLSSTLPALSSEGSPSTSTRSSAYTSSGSALASSDYGHVHVATGDDQEIGVAVGITSDDVVQVLQAKTSVASSGGRTPIDQTRWSEYSASIRSRSSSIGPNTTNSIHESGSMPRLKQNPSFDMGWQTVDERDEVGLTSDDETDDLGGDDDEIDDKEEERTSAAVVAEEGRGLIVKGESIPQLHVEPGTTHLLVGSSSTPNAVPGFLTGALPQICNTLLALDISANFLVALPPALGSCENLEELNIASNPLRVLPVFLTNLTSLRVLIADSTGIGSLPDSLCVLDKLHTLSVRRNKMHSLPSWLCLLPSLQELYLDGNPFQGPWQALVEPLLAKTSMTSLYPPSTPSVLPSPATDYSIGPETDTESEPTSADQETSFSRPEDDTITPARAPFLGRSATSPPILPAPQALPRGLTRTKTAPNGSFFQSKSHPRIEMTVDVPNASTRVEDSGYYTDHDLRRMKSAGELRSSFNRPDSKYSPQDLPLITPARPALPNYSTSASSSNLLSVTSGSPDSGRPITPQRYASLGFSSSSTPPHKSRRAMPQALFDAAPSATPEPTVPDSARTSVVETISPTTSPSRPLSRDPTRSTPGRVDRNSSRQSQSHSKDREKSGRWGFLKKMSMGKMRPGPESPAPSRPYTTYSRTHQPEPFTAPASSSTTFTTTSPQIDVRFSTTGSLGTLTRSVPAVALSTPEQGNESPSSETASPTPPAASSGNFLAPSPSPVPRASRRRSFLPVGDISVTIPTPLPVLDRLSALADDDSDEHRRSPTPSPVMVADTVDFTSRREEERAREAYTRALRSIMAYLKDMNDLGQSQGNTLSMYAGAEESSPSGMRSRRPTIVDRTNSDASTISMSRAGSMSGQLRSPDAMSSLRCGTTSQTVSVATSDGSAEERKYKDDKSKRALVVKEIVETEKTYVKGLQELVDIYIKPSGAHVNLISGVGSGKETIIPAAERRIVFGGVEALFSFHKESFLPSLEQAAAPLLQKLPAGEELDPDGRLSVEVAKAVAGCFLKYAAFMRMYSTYINNFDNSVQRVRFWATDRPVALNASPGLTPSSSTSTVQLAGLGLAISAPSVPVAVSDPSSPNHTAHLTSGQRKRIKHFLKRCRVNPRHSQLNMEGYLLLPVQRIPRYRLLLEELLRSTPPSYTFLDDSLDRALAEISSLASNMNEGKREAESRRKLVQWQSRIRGKFPSPLVQPHRRLIMDGPLLLTRVVRKTVVSFETLNAQGDPSAVQVDCLAPELNPRPLVGVLCNDLLVLCRDPSDGKDPMSAVDLWAVLRMQTLPQPASIVHGNTLRLVDNKAILYFDAPTPSDALNWFRAINLHIPSSKA